MHPRVSIALPFCNAAATLPEALASLRVQTFSNWELVAVDDRSTDGSMEIVRREFQGDARLHVMENRHAPGVTGAMRTASEASRAEWIARMDADDVCDPHRLERQLSAAAEHPDWDVIGSRVGLISPLGDGMRRYVDWANGLLSPSEIAAARFIENPLINPSLMMRRSMLEAFEGYRDAGWAEDHDLWLRALEAGVICGKTPETLLHWRDSPARLTRSDAAYGERARHRMRAHFLSRLPSVRDCGVVIAGAGPIGKELALLLMEKGVALRGFFEVHPRRIGEIIHGAKVADSSLLGSLWRDAVLLSVVGVPGGREKVRALALAAGYAEGGDFWCVC